VFYHCAEGTFRTTGLQPPAGNEAP
jgi:hypothetical protein